MSGGDAPKLDTAWLVRPRWGAVAAFIVTLMLSQLGIVQRIDVWPVLAGAAITALTNLAVPAVARVFRSQFLTVALLAFDVAVLTVVLYFSGGASNPLTALYLMPIALAAVMLPARFSWILSALSASAFFILFFSPGSKTHEAHFAPAASGEHAAHDAPKPHTVFTLHLRGMWVAFTLTAVSMAYFVTQVAVALRSRERELSDVRSRAYRAERVASLAGLAASTAHELGTPLASIQLAASEMGRAIERGAGAPALAPDVALVRDQVRRCREILDAMLSEAGETLGEQPTPEDAVELLRNAIAGFPEADRHRIRVRMETANLPVRVPRRIVIQAVQNLVRNALDASPIEQSVDVQVRQVDTHVAFVIQDRGMGMDRETLQRALEPFVTTKPGRGKGLGLFLTSAVAERLGGELHLESTPGSGTRAVFEIPMDVV